MSSDPNITGGPEPGSTLAGKYLVEEVLGIGGMGVVVAAKHLQLDQKVAIKYLLPQALQNPEVVERFAREARSAAKIRGEHVARVIDVSKFDDGSPYMVLEYLEGNDLAKQLEKHGPLQPSDAVRYLLETCEALAQAHAAKIVHRDLKPSNLFLAEQPDKRAIIKVLDFGISKTADPQSAALTKTSALMGTAFYMSPEQLIAPKTVDHRSDIWSLGVILYELLTGKPPFMGESVPEIIGGILSNSPESLRTKRPDLPAGIEAVVTKCMQTKADDRYQSVATLAAALGPYAADRDRISVEAIARVLGETIAKTGTSSPPARASTVVLTPQEIAPSAVPQAQPQASTVPSAVLPVATAPTVAAVTVNGLSTSTITEKPKRGMMPLVAIGAVVVIAGVGGGIFLSKQKSAADDTKSVAVGLTPSNDPKPASSALPAAASAAPTSTTVLTPIPTETAAAPSATSSAKVGVAATPGTRPTPGATTTAKTPASAAAPVASANPPPSPPASATPAAAASTKANPLQMGIK